MVPTDTHTVTSRDIWLARARIADYVWRTPLLFSPALSRRTGCRIYLKLECWQRCGCFKVRGAINMVRALSEPERQRGLVTASSGNHAIAVAYAASLFGHPPTTVFLPRDADATKVRKIEQWGAEIVFHGQNFLEAYDAALRYTEERGAVYVHSHAHPLIIAGQGTIGLEVVEELPELDAVLVPVGGGGLSAGIATAVQSVAPTVRVIGVEPTAAPAAYRSLRDDVCYERIEIRPSLADGLLGGLGRLPFAILRRRMERVLLVDDAEIVAAMRAFQREEQLMVEAAASVGLAAMLSGKIDLEGQNVVLVVTSRNIDAATYNRVIQKE
jgi:threonine dehydratase